MTIRTFPGNAADAADLPSLNGLTASDVSLADVVAGYDSSSTANRKFTASHLGGILTARPGGRVSLTTDVPVTITNVTAATSVFYSPYLNDRIDLWDGTRWVTTQFATSSLSLSLKTADTNYDVFGFLTSGLLTLELLAWTNATTRATTVTFQDGRYCKSGDKTRLLLGTIRTTSTTGQCEDSQTKRFVWNMYNRASRDIIKEVATAGHSVAADGVFRIWNRGDTTQKVEILLGMAEDSIRLDISGETLPGSVAGSFTQLSIGVGGASPYTGVPVANRLNTVVSPLGSNAKTIPPLLGYYAVYPLESATTSIGIFYDYVLTGEILG